MRTARLLNFVDAAAVQQGASETHHWAEEAMNTSEFNQDHFYDLRAPAADPTGAELSIEDLARPDQRNTSYAGYEVEHLQAVLNQGDDRLSDAVPDEIRKRLAVAKMLATYGWFQWDFYTVSLFWSLSTIEMALKYRFEQALTFPLVLTKPGRERTFQGKFAALERQLRRRWRIKNLPSFNGSFRGLLQWAASSGFLRPDTPILMQELRNWYLNHFNLVILPDRLIKNKLVQRENLTFAEIGSALENLPPEERAAYRPNPIEAIVLGIPFLRNWLAHPSSHNSTLILSAAAFGYLQAIEIIRGMWPNEETASEEAASESRR